MITVTSATSLDIETGMEVTYYTTNETNEVNSGNYQWKLVGDWDDEEKEEIQKRLVALLEVAPNDTFDLYCRYPTKSVPFRAFVHERGRTQRVVAYGVTTLLENIENCYGPFSS